MIRNFLFSYFFFQELFLFLSYLPAIFLPSKNSFIWWKNYGLLDIFMFKNFLSTKIIIKGKENIIKIKNFL